MVEAEEGELFPYMIINKENTDLIEIQKIVRKYHEILKTYTFVDEFSIIDLEMDLIFILIEQKNIKPIEAFGKYEEFSKKCIQLSHFRLSNPIIEHNVRWGIHNDIEGPKEEERIEKIHMDFVDEVGKNNERIKRWFSKYRESEE